MPRKISWLTSVSDLIRAVTNSDLQLYGSGRLQQLFKLKPRATQQLVELMPRTVLGNTFQVEKDNLLTFLNRVRDAWKAGNEPAVKALFEKLRTEDKPKISRRTIRIKIERDGSLSPKNPLPMNVKLSRGRLVIDFATVEDLMQGQVGVASLFAADENAFIADYCPGGRTLTGIVRGARELAQRTAVLEDLAMLEQLRITTPVRPGPQTSSPPQPTSSSPSGSPPASSEDI